MTSLNKDGLDAAHAAYAKTTGGLLDGHPMENAIEAYLSDNPVHEAGEVVARLRAYGGDDQRDYRHVAASALEALQARIAELEAKCSKTARSLDYQTGFNSAEDAYAERVAELEARDGRRLDHIKKLERRIHNQRRSNRDNWEIAERRANWLGTQRSRRNYVDLLVRHRALKTEADALRVIASEALQHNEGEV